MRVVEEIIPILSDDPIELRAISCGDFLNYHRVEYRINQKYFEEHYENKVFPEGDGWQEEKYIGLFGIKRTRKVKVKYVNPWRYIDYKLRRGFQFDGFDFYTVDSHEKFNELKESIKTFNDWEKCCEADKDKKIQRIKQRQYLVGKEWY